MKKSYRKIFLRFLDAFFAAAIVTMIAAAGVLDDWDARASDKLYQGISTKSPDVIVIGLDKMTLAELGPSPTRRRAAVAQAINYLNNHDPNARPAVIGVDLLLTGENSDSPEVDAQLVNVAGQYDNVVFGAETDADDEKISDGDTDFYAVWKKTWHCFPPFPALAEVVDFGHVHAPREANEIMRHGILYVNTYEDGKLYSFSRVVYEKYCKHKGINPNPPPATSDNGIFYLPFTAKSYSCGKNVLDLIQGNVEPEIYRDKIVLIAMYAPGEDTTPTALDKTDVMFGVDVHANIIDAFRKNFFVWEVDKIPQLIILFALSFIAEFYFRRGEMKYVAGLWFILTFGWVGLCKIVYSLGFLFHVVWIPLAISVLFIAAVSTNYLLANAEKDLISETFGRYVDPTIMKQLLEGDRENLDVGGKLHNIAVLFVDIRGFTTMSEQLEAATVVKILNEYLTLTTDCIRKHHGTLDKFVGDCTMAFWNAPVEQKNPVYLACRAAVEMIEGSENLRQKLLKEYGREISFGVGVHWGSAIVGNIGSSFRMDYTAIGDTVNTAARLEANAKGGTILISRAVADILGNLADVTSLGNTIKLKGKSNDFEILKLNSLKEMSDENDR